MVCDTNIFTSRFVFVMFLRSFVTVQDKDKDKVSVSALWSVDSALRYTKTKHNFSKKKNNDSNIPNTTSFAGFFS